jgi:hypothetical protein
MRRSLSLSAVAFFLASSSLLACRNSSTGTGGAGGTTSSETGTSTGTKMSTSSTMSGTTTGTGTGTGTSTGTGGQLGCDGPEHTVQDVTAGTVIPGTKVTLKGVVAMSEKFLVSGSTSCLWGVFVSAPGLTETAANTGLIALSYGTDPMIPPGQTMAFCPKEGQDPAGDKIPDDVKPGDVLDLVGVTAYYTPNCMAPNPVNTVPMRQLGQVCSATKTGTAPIPAAHLMTGTDLAGLSSLTDSSFHDQWGGVKVRIESAAAQSSDTNCPTTPMACPPATPCVVQNFGNILVDPGIDISDKAYYRPYDKPAQCTAPTTASQVCHEGPTYTDTAMTFNSVEGFHYLDFCTWGITVSDKCGDMDPASPDCALVNPAVTTCVGVP